MKSPYIKKWAIWYVGENLTACTGVFDTRKDAKNSIKNSIECCRIDKRHRFVIRHCFMIVPKKGETK